MADPLDGTRQQIPPPGVPPPLGRPPPPPPPLGRPPPPPPPMRLPPDESSCDPSTGERIKKDREEEEQPPKDSKKLSSSSEKEQTGTGGKIKMSFGSSGLLGKRTGGGSAPIKMKLKSQEEATKKTKMDPVPVKKTTTTLVSQAFGSDSEEEEEEMPPEAKLRMRNIGKNTPTSSGPNSFNKSNKGFSDPRGSWRNELVDD